jgi:hypothetical protein
MRSSSHPTGKLYSPVARMEQSEYGQHRLFLRSSLKAQKMKMAALRIGKSWQLSSLSVWPFFSCWFCGGSVNAQDRVNLRKVPGVGCRVSGELSVCRSPQRFPQIQSVPMSRGALQNGQADSPGLCRPPAARDRIGFLSSRDSPPRSIGAGLSPTGDCRPPAEDLNCCLPVFPRLTPGAKDLTSSRCAGACACPPLSMGDPPWGSGTG